jgi:hypothetical protein
MDLIREVMAELRRRHELEDNNDASQESIDLRDCAQKLVGRRIITTDINKANESRPVYPRTDMPFFNRPARVFYCRDPGPRSCLEIAREIKAQTSRFLTLPPEVRLLILEEALMQYQNGTSPVQFANSGIPLILTCKQLWVEGRSIAIRNYTFMDVDLPVGCCLHPLDYHGLREDEYPFRHRYLQ